MLEIERGSTRSYSVENSLLEDPMDLSQERLTGLHVNVKEMKRDQNVVYYAVCICICVLWRAIVSAR